MWIQPSPLMRSERNICATFCQWSLSLTHAYLGKVQWAGEYLKCARNPIFAIVAFLHSTLSNNIFFLLFCLLQNNRNFCLKWPAAFSQQSYFSIWVNSEIEIRSCLSCSEFPRWCAVVKRDLASSNCSSAEEEEWVGSLSNFHVWNTCLCSPLTPDLKPTTTCSTLALSGSLRVSWRRKSLMRNFF